MPSDNQTSCEVDLGGHRLEKAMSSCEVFLKLDDASYMTLVVSMTASDAANLSSSDHPQEGSFQWGGRTLFKGNLSNVSLVDAFRVRLTFHDALEKARKVNENVFFKAQSLQECLDKMVSKAGLSARYVGSFSDSIPALNLANSSVFNHLSELANEFGFFFFAKPASSEVCFLRAGSHVKDVRLEKSNVVSPDAEHRLNASQYVSNAKFRYFDSHSLEPKDKQLGSSELYSQLSSFQEHGTYLEKSSWAYAKGTHEIQLGEGYHFDSADQQVRNQLSKRLMEQEVSTLKVFEPIGVPGDRITLSDSHFSNTQDGAYLIRSSHIVLESAAPYMEMEMIRP